MKQFTPLFQIALIIKNGVVRKTRRRVGRRNSASRTALEASICYESVQFGRNYFERTVGTFEYFEIVASLPLLIFLFFFVLLSERNVTMIYLQKEFYGTMPIP